MTQATFFLDSFVLLPLFAFFIVSLSWKFAKTDKNRKRCLIALSCLTILGFWLIAGGIWYEKIDMGNLPLIGDWFRQELVNGKSFMLNFEYKLIFNKYLVDPEVLAGGGRLSAWNIVAMLNLFIAYPVTLALSIFTRFVMFGRSEKQTGVNGLIPKPWSKK